MEFLSAVDKIVGNRDRVVIGPQRPLSEVEFARFESEVHHRDLDSGERFWLTSLCHLAQYAMAHLESDMQTLANGEERVENLIGYVNDRHNRMLESVRS